MESRERRPRYVLGTERVHPLLPGYLRDDHIFLERVKKDNALVGL